MLALILGRLVMISNQYVYLICNILQYFAIVYSDGLTGFYRVIKSVYACFDLAKNAGSTVCGASFKTNGSRSKMR